MGVSSKFRNSILSLPETISLRDISLLTVKIFNRMEKGVGEEIQSMGSRREADSKSFKMDRLGRGIIATTVENVFFFF